MDYINFKEHLQKILDAIAQDTFEVTHIRQLDDQNGKIQVVFKELAGSIYENSASIPYQIDIFSDKIDEINKIFTDVAKQRNNKSFISVIEEGEETREYTCFEFYSTPAVAEPTLDYGTNRVEHLVIFANINVLFDVGNVSELKIDNEQVEFTNAQFGYVAEMFSNRVSGQELNKAVKKASTTSLQITMVNKTSIFTNKIFNIMFGNLSGKTTFTVKVKLTTGFEGSLTMTLAQNQFACVRNSPTLPSLNITLTNGDNR